MLKMYDGRDSGDIDLDGSGNTVNSMRLPLRMCIMLSSLLSFPVSPPPFFVVSTTVLRRLMSLGYRSMASPPPFSVMIYILFFFCKFSRDDRYVLSCKIHIAPKRLRKSLKSRNTLRMILTYMWILVFRCTCGH